MAPLAGLLLEKGDTVLGSDLPLYPPMSDRIAALGIAEPDGILLTMASATVPLKSRKDRP